MRDSADLIGSKRIDILRDMSLAIPPGEDALPVDRDAWVKKFIDGESETEGWYGRRFCAIDEIIDNLVNIQKDSFEVEMVGQFDADDFHWRNAIGTQDLGEKRPRPTDRVWAHALVDDWRGNKRSPYKDRDHQQHHNADACTVMVRRTDTNEFSDELKAPLSSLLRVVTTTTEDVIPGQDHPLKAYMPKVAFNITYVNRIDEKDGGYLVDMTPVGSNAHGSERWGQLAHVLKITAHPGADYLGPANIDNRQNKRPDIRTTAHFWGADWTDSSDSGSAEHGPLYLTTATAVAPSGGTWYYAHFIWEDPDTDSTNPAPNGPAGYSKVIRPVFMIPDPLEVDAIDESTLGNGVTVDGVLMYDGGVYCTNDGLSAVQLTSYGAGATDIPRLRSMRGRGSEGTPAVVQDDDVLFRADFHGYSANIGSWLAAARMVVEVDGTPDSGADPSDMPGRFRFLTSAEGSATPTERMRIGQNGYVSIGTAADATDMLQVAGVIRSNGGYDANGNVGVTGVWTVAVGDVITIDGGIITGVVSAGWAPGVL